MLFFHDIWVCIRVFENHLLVPGEGEAQNFWTGRFKTLLEWKMGSILHLIESLSCLNSIIHCSVSQRGNAGKLYILTFLCYLLWRNCLYSFYILWHRETVFNILLAFCNQLHYLADVITVHPPLYFLLCMFLFMSVFLFGIYIMSFCLCQWKCSTSFKVKF